jgi:hypothetical protein
MQEIKKTDLSIPLWKANYYSIPIALLISVIIFTPFYLIWGNNRSHIYLNSVRQIAYLLFFFILGIIVHELIHGSVWAVLGKKPFNKIKFGFYLRTLSVYAHTEEPVTAAVYRAGTVAPFILLGLIPSAISYMIGNISVCLFGIVFSAASAGDLLVLWSIRKLNSNRLVEDHPKNAGCYVIEDDENKK